LIRFDVTLNYTNPRISVYTDENRDHVFVTSKSGLGRDYTGFSSR